MIRYLAACIAGAVAFFYLASMVLNWDHFGGRSKRISAASSAVFFSVAYGFYEAAARGVEVGPRTYIILVALVVLLGVLLYRFNEHP